MRFSRTLRLSLAIAVFCAPLVRVAGDSLVSGTAEAQSLGSCGLSQPAFCDTFDQPAGTGNRSGQLNGTVWGASRTTGITNFGQSQYDYWAPTTMTGCSGTSSVR